MTGSNKILIRGLDPDIFRALESMSSRSDRSLEAEARFALRSWVQPALVEEERSLRRTQLAQRLVTSLTQTNEAGRMQLRPSHVAQGIDESFAEPVENWFLGKVEPSFSQLERMADFLGLDKRWLQHGDGTPFPIANVRLSENPVEAVYWLLNLPVDPMFSGDQPPHLFPEMEQLILVRSSTKTGPLAIVKQRDRYRCITYTTPTHVSSEIGAGGEAQLKALAVTLELLYKVYGRMGGPTVKSWIVPDEDFSALVSGQIHPLSLKRGGHERLWWEDIWDEEQAPKQNYWDGWQEIASRIQCAVASNQRLNSLRLQIRDGSHPIFDKLQSMGMRRPGSPS